MNAKSQEPWGEEKRKSEWKNGAKALRVLADKMEQDQIDPGAYWDIELMLRHGGDLWKIFLYGKIKIE